MKKKVLALCTLLAVTASVTGGVQASEELQDCTLTFLSWYPQEKYQPILDAFAEEYPGIEIEFQYAAPVAERVRIFFTLRQKIKRR